ncbi:MAG: hypothetical protein FWD35_06390 [Oscillospiraceae bacterium]|nr:hypothetical protein [Oscillospiraceae bacterium]
MVKKHWRVGSLSMGLIMVVSGVIMLISLFAKINVLDILLAFWPVVLICIGAEILLHLFARKSTPEEGEEVGKIKYDVLSILFVGFILAISMGFYALTYAAGFMFESREDMNTALGIHNQNARVEGTHELSGVSELKVLDGFYHNARVTVLSSPNDTVRVEYVVLANTSNKDYAEELLENVVTLSMGADAQAYLRLDETRFYARGVAFPRIDYVIHLPRNVQLSLPQYWGLHDFDPSLAAQVTHRTTDEYYDYEPGEPCDCCGEYYSATQP